jgi:tRNA A37 methylthiotransferase MiaB
VGFVSLGCPKALVDSERILTRLRAEGYEVAEDLQGRRRSRRRQHLRLHRCGGG